MAEHATCAEAVFVTHFGQYRLADMPDNLRQRLAAARITKHGLPDRRKDKWLWAEFVNWSMVHDYDR